MTRSKMYKTIYLTTRGQLHVRVRDYDAAVADFPVPLTAGSACYMSGRIYYVGGWDGAASDGTHWSFSPDIYIYNIDNKYQYVNYVYFDEYNGATL